MAFTFARCVDAELAEPDLQTTIVGALLTLGLVAPERDESQGALARTLRGGREGHPASSLPELSSRRRTPDPDHDPPLSPGPPDLQETVPA